MKTDPLRAATGQCHQVPLYSRRWRFDSAAAHHIVKTYRHDDNSSFSPSHGSSCRWRIPHRGMVGKGYDKILEGQPKKLNFSIAFLNLNKKIAFSL